jgi:hypothetical protein
MFKIGIKRTKFNSNSKEKCQNGKRFLSIPFQLAEHYGLNPISTKHFGYPYNIALALDDIQKQLKNKVRDWEEIRLIEEKGKLILQVRNDTIQEQFYIIFQ